MVEFISRKKNDQDILILKDSSLSYEKRFSVLQNIFQKNKKEDLEEVEKIFLNFIYTGRVGFYEKTKWVRNLSEITPYMNRYTVQKLFEMVGKLYWILYNLTNNIEDKYYIGKIFIYTEDYAYDIVETKTDTGILKTKKREYVLEELYRLILNNRENLEYNFLADVADSFMLSRIPIFIERGQEIINYLRGRRQEEPENNFFQNTITIYSDSQNVHDSTLNSSVLEIIDKLAELQESFNDEHKILSKTPTSVIDEIELELEEFYLSEQFGKEFEFAKAVESLKRIRVDFAYFSRKNKLTLKDILQRVWYLIKNRMDSESQKEATKRLLEELVEMKGLCSTGHVSRLINVLTGFKITNFVFDSIRISYLEQLKANILARINFRIKTASNCDELLEAMISEGKEREPYRKFLEEIKPSIFEELLKEFEVHFEKEKEDGFTRTNFEKKFEKVYSGTF